MTVRENVAFGLKIRKRPKAEIARARRRAARARAARRASATATRRSSRAASGSAWRSPARSRAEPKVLLLDEPFGALDARVRAELRDVAAPAARRDAHDDGLRHARPGGGDGGRRPGRRHEPRPGRAGRAARASSTTQPANEFVMTFVGQANRFGDACVRPHDLELVARAERHDARGAWSSGSSHLGFEVRVELVARRRRAALRCS